MVRACSGRLPRVAALWDSGVLTVPPRQYGEIELPESGAALKARRRVMEHPASDRVGA